MLSLINIKYRRVLWITLNLIFQVGIFQAQSFTSLTVQEELDSVKSMLSDQPDQALQILETLEKYPLNGEQSSLLGDIHRYKAEAYSSKSDYEKAIEESNKAIHIYSINNKLKKKINLLYWQNNFYFLNNKKEKALDAIKESIEISKALKDTFLIAQSKYNLAGNYYNDTKLDQALKESLEVIDLLKSSKEPNDLMLQTYNMVGNINSLTDQVDKALFYYDKALGECGDDCSPAFLTQLYFNTGNAYYFKDSIEKASEYYYKAYEAGERSNNPKVISFANITLGEFLLIERNLPELATVYLRKSYDYYSSNNALSYKSYTLGLLGIASLSLGNENEAFRLFNEMEALFPKFIDTRNKAEIIEKVADACSKNHPAKAYKYLKIKQDIDKEIFDENSQNELLKLKSDYRLKEKEFEISTLKNTNLNQTLIGSLLILFLAAIGVFAYILWSQKSRLKENNVELKKAKQKAIKLAKSKTDFLATMSHEIRTPMNGVIGMANILAGDNPRPDQKENLEILKFSADNLLLLINDILDLSKIDSGKIELEQNEFDLQGHIQKLFSIFKAANKKKNVDLKLDFQLENLSKQLIGDTLRLNQVVTNLFNNALKFTDKGTVTLKIKNLDQRKDKIKIRFEIIDTGIGISEKNQKSIFEKYQQAENETSRLYGGTGLGLNIAKEIIELHGGELKLQSDLGIGSNFFFEIEFPLSAKAVEIPVHSKTNYKSTDLNGMKILLAEDNKVNQMVAKRLLSKWGIEIKIAEDGIEAISFFKTNEFDLILMDIQMPKMDGFEAARNIRKLPNGDLPIYSMSASTFSKNTKTEDKKLMNGHIGKPFNPNELFKLLHKHVPQKKLIELK